MKYLIGKYIGLIYAVAGIGLAFFAEPSSINIMSVAIMFHLGLLYMINSAEHGELVNLILENKENGNK